MDPGEEGSWLAAGEPVLGIGNDGLGPPGIGRSAVRPAAQVVGVLVEASGEAEFGIQHAGGNEGGCLITVLLQNFRHGAQFAALERIGVKV